MTWHIACTAAATWAALAGLGLAFFQGAKQVSTARYATSASRSRPVRAPHLHLVG